MSSVPLPAAGSVTDHPSPVVAFLRRAHARHLANRAGAVATYIPELGAVDPEAFGIVIATVDGITVYRDHADVNQFWYLPGPVGLGRIGAWSLPWTPRSSTGTPPSWTRSRDSSGGPRRISQSGSAAPAHAW